MFPNRFGKDIVCFQNHQHFRFTYIVIHQVLVWKTLLLFIHWTNSPRPVEGSFDFRSVCPSIRLSILMSFCNTVVLGIALYFFIIFCMNWEIKCSWGSGCSVGPSTGSEGTRGQGPWKFTVISFKLLW